MMSKKTISPLAGSVAAGVSASENTISRLFEAATATRLDLMLIKGAVGSEDPLLNTALHPRRAFQRSFRTIV